jgi:predicted dehydrogenase
MITNKPINIGVIGLGRMGQNHLRVLSLLADAKVKFVYDLNTDEAKRIVHGKGIHVAENLSHALADVDAVVIASPTTVHLDNIIQASEMVKNIFVEKPIADTLANTLKVEKAIKEHGVNLQVGFIERFNPAVAQMKRLMDQSEQVVSIDFTRTNKLSARITDVDVVTDLMIHDIDLALHLNGPVTSVFAHGVVDGNMVGYAAALLTHQNGRFSRIQASRITDKKIRSIQATCKDMYVDCELLQKEITISRQSMGEERPGEPYRIIGVEEKIEVQPREALQIELLSFLASCRGDITEGRPGIEAGICAMQICDEVIKTILGANGQQKI